MSPRPAEPPTATPPVLLSIVIPAHNEESRLEETLLAVSAFVERNTPSLGPIEVLLVDNASRDRTAEIARQAAKHRPWLRVLPEERRGKGAAVRTGMLAARGEYRFFADADLSMPIDGLLDFLPPRRTEHYDVAIGSREAPGARRIGEPASRHLMGRVFNLWVQRVALPGIRDTQCGFKCFRAAAADTLFRLQRVDDWSFDVELLLLARQLGLTVIEVPIEWHYRDQSRVRPVRDSLRMAGAVLAIGRRLRASRRG